MDVYGKNPCKEDGKYFRANVWSWRPIHALCETVLGKSLPEWSYNDGAGLDEQQACNELASKLEAYLKQFPNERIEVESEMRVDAVGRLTRGTGGQSAYQTDREHVQKFISFLRSCGGFEIC